MSLPVDARETVLALAQPIADPVRREQFLIAVEARLAASPAVGPGEAWRAGRELQRQYFDPISTHGGVTGRRV
jgi:hypothetical protein